MSNVIDLEGRTAVVTGGAQGFGKAITERFIKSGARVAIWDHDIALAQKTAKTLGEQVTAIACDVAEAASVAKACDATIKGLGRIDILINNAGIAGANAKTWETEVEEWRKVMRINLDGPFICSRAVVPGMIAQNYGRIVNIASIAGKEGNPNAAHYSASKAGVIALTKSLGKELAGYDIAVNCRDARRRQDRDLRPDDAGAHRLHALQDPARPLRDGRRGGGAGGLDRQPGELLHHRRRVRHLRRPRDVLTGALSLPLSAAATAR